MCFFGLCEPVCVSLPLHCACKTYDGTVNVPARLSLYKTSSLFTGAMTHGCYSEEALTATQLIRSIWLHMTVPPFISLCLCASTGPSLFLSLEFCIFPFLALLLSFHSLLLSFISTVRFASRLSFPFVLFLQHSPTFNIACIDFLI